MQHVVAAAVYSAGHKIRDITLDEGRHWSRQPGHFAWIGLHDPGAEELRLLQ